MELCVIQCDPLIISDNVKCALELRHHTRNSRLHISFAVNFAIIAVIGFPNISHVMRY